MNDNEYVDREIQNVNLICGQIENYVKVHKIPQGNFHGQIVYKKKPPIYIKSTKPITPNIHNPKRGRHISLDLDYLKRKDTLSPQVNTESTGSKKKSKNASVETPQVFSRLYEAKNRKQEESKVVNTKGNKVIVDSMLHRFKECQAERSNRIQEMKRKFQEKEEENITNVPQINKNKNSKTGEDFLTRMENLKQQSDKKKKEMLEKEEERKSLKEKEILDEMNQKNKKKLGKDYLNVKINNMLEWDNTRKEKLKQIANTEHQKQYSECTFKPEINKNSAKIANLTEETVERLYKQDIIKRKQKLELLEDSYTPSFSPIINTYYKQCITEVESSGKGSDHLTEPTELPEGTNTTHLTNQILSTHIDIHIVDRSLQEHKEEE